MNHREPTSAPPRGVGRALPCLAAILLPLLAADHAWSRPASRGERILNAPRAYLPAIGTPSLRFLAQTPPPDLVTHPPASAPPQPATDLAPESDITLQPITAELITAAEAPVASETPIASGEPTPAMARPAAPILVDELRPRVRAEDFLPYFQIPAEHSGDATILVPIPRGSVTPSPLPTSSATYTQTPR